VVVGGAYPGLDRLRTWTLSQPGVTVHVDTHDMASLMAAADLSIGAPSSASWERCTLGLPCILVVLAENQVEVGGMLEASGAGLLLGWHHEVTTEDMIAAVAALARDPSRLRAMGRAAAGITDGLGTTRVAEAIEMLLATRPEPDSMRGAVQ
jgi:UDP-2,4-diacetamido-2,4,6-trideoxy-beta-L-altropyranose hydrolase